MIPVQLTIHGLYSYQEKQTIDFKRLTAANLFGIFGSVGCGKSSILEAITFAIYGRTTRLNLTGDNRYYNMMNLKSDQLFIEFIFETGKDQTAYRSVVKGRRNSKKFDEVKALDRFAYKKNDEGWVPVENTELENAIGLSYDNFRRTIIIPQGQFQEFLQLGNKDRSQMMKELFNLEKFEFFNKVASVESKNNALKQNIEGQLLQLGEIDDASAAIYQQQLNQLQSELENLKNLQTGHQSRDEELNKLRDLAGRLDETIQQLNLVQKQEHEFKLLEKNIGEYELCVGQFKHLLSSLDDCAERQGKREEWIRKEEKKLELLNKEISITEELLKEIKPAYDNREKLRQQIDELGLLVKITGIKSDIDKNQFRYSKGKGLTDKIKSEIDDLTKKKALLEAANKELKECLPDLAVLAEIKTWHAENKNLQKQQDDIDLQVKKLAGEVLTIEQSIRSALSDPLFGQLQDLTNIQAAYEFLNAKNEGLKEKQKALERQRDELRVKDQLQKYAGELKEGKACPLCGSLSHPLVYNVEDIRDFQSHLQVLKEELQMEFEQIGEKNSQLNDLQSKMNFCTINLNDWERKKKDIAGRIETHMQAFMWDLNLTDGAINEAFTQAKNTQGSIKANEDQLENLNKLLESELQNKERYQSELDKISNDLIALKTEAKTLQQQLTIIDPDEYAKKTVAEIEAKKEALNDACQRSEKRYNALNKQLEEYSKKVNSIAGGLYATHKELALEKDNLKMIAAQVDEALAKNSYESVEKVRNILAQPIIIEEEKKKLAAYKERQAVLNNLYFKYQKEINNRTYDQEAHKKLKEELENCKELINQKNQLLGNLTGVLAKLQQDLEQKDKLVREQQKLELRAVNIKTMKSLFKASGFVNYISSVYLQNLCNAANERFFQLTRQKLSLEITPDNNFQVRDFMNGGKIRSVKTLSGGQTFQAALSLALALADNIQKITASNQNFFFLDEGFGSLDKESLAVVFDTLKTLRKENRIVGVISHVEEMQQEIDVHLQIEHKEERGSIIYPGWVSSKYGHC